MKIKIIYIKLNNVFPREVYEFNKKRIKKNPNFIVPIAFDDIYKVVFGTEENADITAYLVSLLF